MDVLILHYHLNPGGVTRIIESQVQGLLSCPEHPRIKILCGVTSGIPEIAQAEIIQDCLLNYTLADISYAIVSQNLSALLTLIRSHLTGQTVIHCHNPNLGKNPALTVALFKLASEGVPVINHCHDFPEDRPANMELLERTIPPLTSVASDQVLYPDFKKYHFVVLNSCDHQRLIEKGIVPGRIHMIPNPVPAWVQNQTEHPAQREKLFVKLGFANTAILCTYPVRAIQRKNIGEFILMSVLFAGTANFAITLAPLNPAEIPGYERWKSFCRKHALTVRFEAGATVDYAELIKFSDFCITTSVREGFGMVYLEPWQAGTPVIGRELTCIITDLKKKGLQFPRLYNRLAVMIHEKKADFKDLSPDDQEIVIVGAARSADTRQEIMDANPFLKTWLDKIPDGIIYDNQRIIRQKFSIEEYGKQVLGIYSEISQ